MFSRATAVVADTLLEDAVDAEGQDDSCTPWLRPYLPDCQDGRTPAEDLRQRFLEAVAHRGLDLYAKQEEAIRRVFDDCHVVLSTPTGSGKTLVATSMLYRAVADGRRAYYTCPIKALVSEKFFDLCRDFGPDLVGMATGDVSINPQAPIICCTAEVLANIALRDGASASLDYAILDEFHYFSDTNRGFAWEAPLLRLPHVTFLLMSGTLGDNPKLYQEIERLTGRSVCVISSKDRPVPLDWHYLPRTVQDAIGYLVEQRWVPIYVVNFTQLDAARLAKGLVSYGSRGLTKPEKKQLKKEVDSFSFDSPYGPTLRNLLVNGIGLHHAGLLPKYRLLVERLAQAGKLICICGTDTLGVGINVPIRTVLFTQLCKYDGEGTDILDVRHFHQIAGRAGRRGFDNQGTVVAVPPPHVVYNQGLEEKMKAAPNDTARRKLGTRKQSAPQRNYKHWDESTFAELQQSDPAPLVSRFRLTQGSVLSIFQGAELFGRDANEDFAALLESAQCSDKERDFWREQIDSYIASLESSDLIRREGNQIVVEEGLQQDFLLMEDVSLFLVDCLPLVRWAASDDGFAHGVLSMVEAVCENPKAVLKAQIHLARSNKNAELKQRHARYEERKAAASAANRLKPLPGGDLVSDAFRKFVREHPWVDSHALQPKSVALEMYEGFLTFSEYVKRLNSADKFNVVASQEGLLLRYLSQVLKTLRHNVPEDFKTDDLLEIEAYLQAEIAATDSSLLQEWQTLKDLEQASIDGGDASPSSSSTPDALKPKTALEERFLSARAKVDMLRFVRHLARREWTLAAGLLRCPAPDGDATAGATWGEGMLRQKVLARGVAFSADKEGVYVEVEEVAEGLRVCGTVDAQEDPSVVALEIEAFVPWPHAAFEPLLVLEKMH